MDFLKRNIKQILVNRQHRVYDREVRAKNLNYDRWIRQQEEKLPIADAICYKEFKCLINDSPNAGTGGSEMENGGNHSKIDDDCRIAEFTSTCGQKKQYLVVAAELFCREIEAFWKEKLPEVLLLTLYPGEVSEFAFELIERCFCENENAVVVYGDEDVQRGGVREDPWFKPDWSPDRFLSCFYFGALVAVKANALKEAYVSCKADGGIPERQEIELHDAGEEENRELLYLLLHELIQRKKGYTKRTPKWHTPVCHVREVLYHSINKGYDQIKGMKLSSQVLNRQKHFLQEDEKEAKTLLSIIIPSKDNPDVLFHCLDSLLEKTDSNCVFELIVVDNGSSRENQRRIQDKILKLNEDKMGKDSRVCLKGCRYLYQPMTFNFSRMCNLGAKDAKGKILLFLNDDMEIIQPEWMDSMLESVTWDYAGAVGAKLLYPDSEIIQHAGVTNLRVGPAHKLQFLTDQEEHYFGMNRGRHNMLAVTAACLMVRREVFEEVGGFCEDLAVAFNDVDFCYTIYEHGYYNIERNDVVLYHHESLSRGKDGESPEKQLRLLKEKDLLYERHQSLYGKDPYYHPYLTTDMLESEYSPACRYRVTLDMPWTEVTALEKEIQGAREDQCLVVGMECAMDIYKWQYGVSRETAEKTLGDALGESASAEADREDMGYYFQGYSFVIGSDNACYKKKLLLRNQADHRIWSLTAESRYRKDIRDNLKDQLNVDLTGFAAKMRKGEIPAGVYQFGMLAEDQCSRQKLVNWSNWVLEVDTDGN